MARMGSDELASALNGSADHAGRYGVQQVYREAGEVKALDVTSLAEGPDGEVWAGASAGACWLPPAAARRFFGC